jgi:hypothetical protein
VTLERKGAYPHPCSAGIFAVLPCQQRWQEVASVAGTSWHGSLRGIGRGSTYLYTQKWSMVGGGTKGDDHGGEWNGRRRLLNSQALMGHVNAKVKRNGACHTFEHWWYEWQHNGGVTLFGTSTDKRESYNNYFDVLRWMTWWRWCWWLKWPGKLWLLRDAWWGGYAACEEKWDYLLRIEILADTASTRIILFFKYTVDLCVLYAY